MVEFNEFPLGNFFLPYSHRQIIWRSAAGYLRINNGSQHFIVLSKPKL